MRIPHPLAFFFGILFWLLAAQLAYAADTSVGTGNNNPDQADALWGPYYISTTVGLIVRWDAGDDLNFSTTDDGGATWSTTEVEAGQNVQLACYAKYETTGFDTTTDDQVACVWHDAAGSDAIKFVEFDISAGTAGTVDTITSGWGGLSGSATNNRTAITITESGRYIIVGNDGGSVSYGYDSTDGTTWSTIASPMNSSSRADHIILLAADGSGTGDTDDACLLYIDRDGNDFDLKTFDESANTWTQHDIDTTISTTANYKNMDGAIRHSDSAIIAAVHSNDDSTGDDLRVWEILCDSIASPTITAKTDVFTNQKESGQVSVNINQINDDIYIAYSEGDTSYPTSSTIKYHLSTDDAATWGGQTAYGESVDDMRLVHGPRSITSSGGMMQFSFFDDDDKTYYVNLVNDISIAASGGGGPTVWAVGVN